MITYNKQLKIQYNSIVLICLFVWSISSTLFMSTTLTSIAGLSCAVLYTAIWTLIRILLIIKILIYTIYRMNELFMIVLLFAVSYLIGHNSGSYEMMTLVFFVIALRDINDIEIVKSILYAQVIGVIIVVILALSGTIPNEVSFRASTSAIRYAMGFTHPNLFAAKILQICLLYVYLRYHDLKKLDYVLLAIGMIITKIVTDSRTVSFLIMCLIVLLFITIHIRERPWLLKAGYRKILILKQIPLVVRGMIISVVIFSIYAAIYYNYSDWLKYLNRLWSTRIQLMNAYYSAYKISLFGEHIVISNNPDVSYQYTVDNAYIYTIIRYGFVYLVLLIIGYMKLTKYASKQNNNALLVIILIYTVYGLLETYFCRVSYNFTLLLFSQIIWSRKAVMQTENFKQIQV